MNEHEKVMGFCRRIVDSGIADDGQCSNFITFFGEYAIKYPKYSWSKDRMTQQRIYSIKELFIGEAFEKGRIPGPKMYALDMGNDSQKPFLVMERLHFENRDPTKEEINLYYELEGKVNTMGYRFSDTSPYYNCGIDEKKGLCFYDFEYMKGPKVDEIIQAKSHLIKPGSQIVLSPLEIDKVKGGLE